MKDVHNNEVSSDFVIKSIMEDVHKDRLSVEANIQSLNLFEEKYYKSSQYKNLLNVDSKCRGYIKGSIDISEDELFNNLCRKDNMQDVSKDELVNDFCQDIIRYVSHAELCKLILPEIKRSAQDCLDSEDFPTYLYRCEYFKDSYVAKWLPCSNDDIDLMEWSC